MSSNSKDKKTNLRQAKYIGKNPWFKDGRTYELSEPVNAQVRAGEEIWSNYKDGLVTMVTVSSGWTWSESRWTTSVFPTNRNQDILGMEPIHRVHDMAAFDKAIIDMGFEIVEEFSQENVKDS